MSKKIELATFKIFEALPSSLIFEIANFTHPQALLCWSLTSRSILTDSKSIFKRLINQNFPKYIRNNESDKYEIRDVMILWSILNLNLFFSKTFHLHETFYYSRLILDIKEIFLERKKKQQQSIADFPWLAYVMGNIMRVEDKKQAADYFIIASEAKSPLPLAKIGLALTLNVEEFAKLKKNPFAEEKKQSLSEFNVDVQDDFIVSHKRRVCHHVTSSQLLTYIYNLYPKYSQEHFEFLEKNYEYSFIFDNYDNFLTQKTIDKTKLELINDWFTEMQESKDPVSLNHMSDALLELLLDYYGAIASVGLTNEEHVNTIKECLNRGGFVDSVMLKALLIDFPKVFKISYKEILQKQILAKPNQTGYFLYLLAESTDCQEEKLSYYWQAICKGFPPAVLANYLIGDIEEQSTNDWKFLKERPGLTLLPYHLRTSSESSDKIYCLADYSWSSNSRFKSEFFETIFIAQKILVLSPFLLPIHLKDNLIKYKEASQIKLKAYRESSNIETRAVACTAIALAALEQGKYAKADWYLYSSKAAIIAVEYLRFARQQGHLLRADDYRLLSHHGIDLLPLADNKNILLKKRGVPVPTSPTGAVSSSPTSTASSWSSCIIT